CPPPLPLAARPAARRPPTAPAACRARAGAARDPERGLLRLRRDVRGQERRRLDRDARGQAARHRGHRRRGLRPGRPLLADADLRWSAAPAVGHAHPARGGDPGGARMSFPANAAVALEDEQLRRNLHKAPTTIRAKRARAGAELPDWDELREAGAAIKAAALATLPEQLERL